MLADLARQTVAAEQPVLAAHGLSMWGYIVLSALDRSPVRTQAALAEAIGADKTRIIPTLDELQEHGFIERIPDPDDRRARLLEITESGRSTKTQRRLPSSMGRNAGLDNSQPATEMPFCERCGSSPPAPVRLAHCDRPARP